MVLYFPEAYCAKWETRLLDVAHLLVPPAPRKKYTQQPNIVEMVRTQHQPKWINFQKQK